jgi:hypothetical protein
MSYLDDPGDISPRLFQDGIDVGAACLRFFCNAALDQVTVLVCGNLAGDVELGSNGDGLALLIVSNCLSSFEQCIQKKAIYCRVCMYACRPPLNLRHIFTCSNHPR